MLKEKDTTAAALSRKAGLNLRAVTDIIDGRAQSPRLSTVYVLCQALDMSLEDMLDSSGPKTHASDANISAPQIHPEVEQFLLSLSAEEQKHLLQSIRTLAGYWKQEPTQAEQDLPDHTGTNETSIP